MTGSNNLVEAYHGVYCSSKEIIKNKQKHLYVNMLDLLTRTTKAAFTSEKALITDEYVKFWLLEILPLMFDDDKMIQDNAIIATETVIHCFNEAQIQSLPEWPLIKKYIVEDYSAKLHEMRKVSNSNWYKIWSLLIRILNKEVLKGATVINTFLSIVEFGFRSSDYKVRAEAFMCWKVLVEIFAKYNEIFSPKRIKLICIPLKSSQSKTLETAVNKYKVWWYFLCKLNGQIINYSDTTFEPFLLSCFGGTITTTTTTTTDKNAPLTQGTNYSIVKQMAIACLIEMLGPSSKETQCLLESSGLERPERPLINTELMMKCGKAIINACFEATVMIAEKSTDRTKLFELLWRNLFTQILKASDLDLYYYCCNKIKILIDTEIFKEENSLQRYILYILEIFGTYNKFPFENFIVNSTTLSTFCKIISEITELVGLKEIKCPKEISEAILNNIYDVEKFKTSTKYWELHKTLTGSIINNETISFIIKMIIWKRLTNCLINYLNERSFEFRIEKNAEVINNWLFWPLDKCTEETIFDETFLSIWKNLVMAASKSEGACNFTRYVSEKLKILFEKEYLPPKFSDFLSIIIVSLDVTFDESTKPIEIFDLINNILSKPVKKGETNNKIIESLSIYINNLQDNQILNIFNNIKTITLTLINSTNLKSFSKHSLEEFKRTVMEKLKTNKIAKDKKFLKEFKELFKNEPAPFVIIPTLWSYNPDKLTDHQKEKMKEKRNDIPALYNDISHDQSHSQEVIKPWTPRKIVIAKGKNSEEIVIENKENNDNEDDELLPAIANWSYFESENENVPNKTVPESIEVLNENDKSVNTQNVSTEDDDNKLVKADSTDTIKIDSNENDNVAKGSKQKPIEESEKKTKKMLTEEDEELLKKYNVQIEDEKKKLIVARQLKSMEIDTVEGNTFVKVQERLRSKRLGKNKEDSTNRKGQRQSIARGRVTKEGKTGTTTPINDNIKKRRNARKSLTFDKNIDNSVSDSSDKTTPGVLIQEQNKNEEKEKNSTNNSSSDEIIESSQDPSQSILGRKLALRRSYGSNSGPNSPNRNILNFIKSSDITEKKREFAAEEKKEKVVDSPPAKSLLAPPPPRASVSPQSKNKDIVDLPPTKNEKEIADITPTTPEKSPSRNTVIKSPAKFQKQADSTSNEEPNKKQLIEEDDTDNKVTVAMDVDDNLIPETLNTIKSPRKESPGSRKSPRKLFTQNQNVQLNDEVTSTQNKDSIETPLKSINMEDKVVPSTSICDEEDIQNLSLCADANKESSKSNLNKSIVSSPEYKDAEERSAEFVNDTLNISPIVNNDEKISTNSETESFKSLNDEMSSKTAKITDERKNVSTNEGEKLSSPKRHTKNYNNLTSSPPDRKHTSNLESPIVKPKPVSQLTGRGAQFINMIRNKKLDIGSKAPVNALMTAKIETKSSTPENANQGQHPQPYTPNNDEATVPSNVSHKKDLLVFSKALPSPNASPSASILKRKFRQESFDECDSPANKRKRVSFHDPPVSVTKEYVKDVNEERHTKSGFNRCLMLDKTSTPHNSNRSPFKRKSRVDSILELSKFADTPVQSVAATSDADVSSTSREATTMDQTSTVMMESLKWNSTIEQANANAQIDDDTSLTPSPSLYFTDDDAVFGYIFDKYQIEDILEKYLNAGRLITNKSVKAITKEISNAMAEDVKLKTNVLEMLSEKHPKDFLDHAIQENLSSVVCDRLNPSSVVEFVCEKAKINSGMRKRLLEQVQNLLANKLSTEKYELLLSLLSNHEMSDRQVIDCIDAIVKRHKKNQITQSNDGDAKMDSAVEQSPNTIST